jgi:hypothetical protein
MDLEVVVGYLKTLTLHLSTGNIEKSECSVRFFGLTSTFHCG